MTKGHTLWSRLENIFYMNISTYITIHTSSTRNYIQNKFIILRWKKKKKMQIFINQYILCPLKISLYLSTGNDGIVLMDYFIVFDYQRVFLMLILVTLTNISLLINLKTGQRIITHSKFQGRIMFCESKYNQTFILSWYLNIQLT